MDTFTDEAEDGIFVHQDKTRSIFEIEGAVEYWACRHCLYGEPYP